MAQGWAQPSTARNERASAGVSLPRELQWAPNLTGLIASRATSMGRPTTSTRVLSATTKWESRSLSISCARRHPTAKEVSVSLEPTFPLGSPYFRLAASLPTWGDWKGDDSATFARTFAAKGYYSGEAAQTGTLWLLFLVGATRLLSATQTRAASACWRNWTSSPSSPRSISSRSSSPIYVDYSTVQRAISSKPRQ